MRHMLPGHNLGLITSRTVYGSIPWRDVQVTQDIVEFGIMATRPGNSAPVFPLYTYPAGTLFDADEKERESNLTPEFVQELSGKLKLQFIPDGLGDLRETIGPENLFRYAYAVLHAPTYRNRFAELLKIDFPRLPLTTELSLFSALNGLGQELISLHLMDSPVLDTPFATFPKCGSNVLDIVAKHDAEENRVYVNKEGQYFDNVPEKTWCFHIGGYQVLAKWLKDRKGRNLSEGDIEHYKKVVKALHETTRIMREIDEVIEAHGGWPLPGSVSKEGEVVEQGGGG